jgi:Protein of unknown function (DUF2471)
MIRGFEAAVAAVDEVVRLVVLMHRSDGLLTWRLIRTIEAEVLAELSATGRHSQQVLNMLRAPDTLGYPEGDLPVSFNGHDFSPVVFGAIDEAWRRVH